MKSLKIKIIELHEKFLPNSVKIKNCLLKFFKIVMGSVITLAIILLLLRFTLAFINVTYFIHIYGVFNKFYSLFLVSSGLLLSIYGSIISTFITQGQKSIPGTLITTGGLISWAGISSMAFQRSIYIATAGTAFNTNHNGQIENTVQYLGVFSACYLILMMIWVYTLGKKYFRTTSTKPTVSSLQKLMFWQSVTGITSFSAITALESLRASRLANEIALSGIDKALFQFSLTNKLITQNKNYYFDEVSSLMLILIVGGCVGLLFHFENSEI